MRKSFRTLHFHVWHNSQVHLPYVIPLKQTQSETLEPITKQTNIYLSTFNIQRLQVRNYKIIITSNNN